MAFQSAKANYFTVSFLKIDMSVLALLACEQADVSISLASVHPQRVATMSVDSILIFHFH